MFLLAWRNLWRNPKRTLLTVSAIAFATAVLEFFIGIQFESYDSAIKSSVSLYQGTAQLQAKGYNDKANIRKSFADSQRLVEVLEAHEQISATSTRAMGFALVSSDKRSYATQIVGIDPTQESTVSTIHKSIKQGEYLTSSDSSEAIIGAPLARNLKISVGQELTLLGQARDGSVVATVLKLKGIYESGAPDLDRSIVFMPLKSFQEEFSMQGHVHAVVLQALDLDQLSSTIAELESKIQSKLGQEHKLEILSWEQIMPGLKESIELDMASAWLFYFSLVLIVAFMVINTFLMSILERKKEFGTMMALGTAPVRIVAMIILEVCLLSLVGVVVGTAIGSSVLVYFNSSGFAIPGTEEIMQTWNLPARIYPELTLRVLITAPLILIITSLIGIVFPALKIGRLKPLEAMNS